MTEKQTILITGATGNIRGGAAFSLAKRGAKVVLLGRKLETLEARANSIRSAIAEEQIEGQDTDIDKSDPELEKRWPTGFLGFFWRVLTMLFAKPPAVAGEPIADLMLSHPDRGSINGALFKLNKHAKKPDKAMSDEEFGNRLWNELVRLTGLTPD